MDQRASGRAQAALYAESACSRSIWGDRPISGWSSILIWEKDHPISPTFGEHTLRIIRFAIRTLKLRGTIMNVGESHPAFPRKTTPGVPALRPTQLCGRPAWAHREPLPRIAQIADSIHDLDVGAGPPSDFRLSPPYTLPYRAQLFSRVDQIAPAWDRWGYQKNRRDHRRDACRAKPRLPINGRGLIVADANRARPRFAIAVRPSRPDGVQQGQ
jgi:hypothetical protein